MTQAPSSTRPDAAPPQAHLWPDSAAVDADGRLRLAGFDVAALAGEYGTPLYVFDEATLRAQCRAFRHALAARWPASAVAYAGKAYLSPAFCTLLQEEGLELDAASAGEIGVARAAGYPPARIHLHGNFKPDAELAVALDAGVGRIVVDSLDELARVEALARAGASGGRPRPVAIWLRLCPDVATDTHTYVQTGHAASKFGFDVASGAALSAAQQAIASPWLDLAGLHAHAGSQLFDLTPVARVVAFLVEFAALVRERFGASVRELSPGGGLAVAYAPGESVPSIESYAETVTQALAAAVARHHLASPRLVVEPGRAIVARAGIALYTAGPRKAVPDGPTLLAVDGGMGDNPRPALYGARYHAALVEHMMAPPDARVRVVGRYCESGDVLVDEVALPPSAPGDVLAIPVSGAYHLPLASNYNLVPRPAVVFVREGCVHLVRRRETVDDLLRLEMEVR